MEREPIVKTTLTLNPNSLHYRSFVPKNSQKEPSFSTFLKPEPPKTGPGEDIVGGTLDDCDQISVFEAENYFNESTDRKDKTKSVPEMENKVALECSIANSRLAYRVNSFHATPTASSEASWNSQTGLLTNPQGSAPISLRSFSNDSPKGSPRRVKNWFLMRKCPCFGNKSVQVKGKPQNSGSNSSVLGTKKSLNSTSISSVYDSRKIPNPTTFEPKITLNPSMVHAIFDSTKNPVRGADLTNVPQTQSSETQRLERSSFTSNEPKPEAAIPNFRRFSLENQFPKATHLRSSFPNTGNGYQFSFPILNSQIKNLPNHNLNSLDDPPRESLEVFQPAPDPDSGGKIRRNYPFPPSPMSRIASTEDDAASDASSDLFEIDSFSNINNTNSNNSILNEDNVPFSKYRPSIDSVAATECYAPSEASVEWSVATEHGFDKGSFANFSASVSQVDFGTKYSGGDHGDRDTWHGLGCRGEKDVSVVRREGKEGGATWGRHGRGGDRDGFCYGGDGIYPIFQ